MPPVNVAINIALVAAMVRIGMWCALDRRRAAAAMAASAALLVLGVAVFARPDFAVRVLPMESLLFHANLFPLAAALFAPSVFAFARKRGQRIRMGVLCGTLFALSLWDYGNFLAPLARVGPAHVDENGIVRQTSGDTCSAAAVATLLGRHGIALTEAEAVRLCHTRAGRGTTHLGTWRALNAACDRRDRRVVLRHPDVDGLLALGTPALVTVGLPRLGASAEAKSFGRTYDWQPGVLHDVVLLGPDPERAGHVLVGEPDFGLESWPVEHLRYLYRGYALWIETRPMPFRTL